MKKRSILCVLMFVMATSLFAGVSGHVFSMSTNIVNIDAEGSPVSILPSHLEFRDDFYFNSKATSGASFGMVFNPLVEISGGSNMVNIQFDGNYIYRFLNKSDVKMDVSAGLGLAYAGEFLDSSRIANIGLYIPAAVAIRFPLKGKWDIFTGCDMKMDFYSLTKTYLLDSFKTESESDVEVTGVQFSLPIGLSYNFK